MKRVWGYVKNVAFIVLVFTFVIGVSTRAEAEESEFIIKDKVLVKYQGNSKNVVIPDYVKSIGDNAFEGSQIEKVTISKSVKKIGSYAFSKTNLKSIDLPANVKEIGGNAFLGCESLANVKIRNKKVVIGQSAFKNTEWLKKQKDEFVVVNGNLILYNGTSPIIYIPNTVRVICGGTFTNNEFIEIVRISDSVKIIGDNAFSYMEYLSDVTMTDSVVKIGKEAFYLCKNIFDIELSQNLKEVGDEAFYNTSIEDYILPTSVKKIGEKVFGQGFSYYYDMTSGGYFVFFSGIKTYEKYEGKDKKVTIDTGYGSIGASSFENNTQIKEIVIPEGVVLLERSAFAGCTNLEKVYLPSTLLYIECLL